MKRVNIQQENYITRLAVAEYTGVSLTLRLYTRSGCRLEQIVNRLAFGLSMAGIPCGSLLTLFTFSRMLLCMSRLDV
jgi:hypothetical protein